MSIEAWSLKEEENKKKKISEKQQKENNRKIAEHHKIKEKIWVEIEAEENLLDLKELVELGVISKETAEKVASWNDINEEVINDIFEKIDELENIKDIDKYLPPELRISHDDYIKALHDDIFRVQMLTKLDSALTLLAEQINPNSTGWVNLFSWFLTVLDKNLIIVQENTIDVKDSLQEVEKKKFWKKKDNGTLWQKFIDFIK